MNNWRTLMQCALMYLPNTAHFCYPKESEHDIKAFDQMKIKAIEAREHTQHKHFYCHQNII